MDRLPFGPALTALIASFIGSFRSRAALQLGILALRHQIGVLRRSVKTANADQCGPPALGVAPFGLARLAVRHPHRASLNRRGMASQRLSPVLDWENSTRQPGSSDGAE